MFTPTRPTGNLTGAFNVLMLTYHMTARSVRGGKASAIWSLINNITRALIMVAAFMTLYYILGMRGSAIRGDYMIYVMTGIFLYITHISAVSSMGGAGASNGGLAQHAPLTAAVMIFSAALSSLYNQVLSVTAILIVYYVGFSHFTIYDWWGTFCMLVLAWFFGIAVGILLNALQPWVPTLVTKFRTIYQRAQMVTSGKMFVANALPPEMIRMFDWNPLFHTIDQARGFAFINYFPHKSSWEYALTVCVILIVIGLMGEFFTRQHRSLSWTKG
ncbi:ABC transporter permease [Palleronia caenipelagi]|uniref:ABC transporter permease n=1 Tax=Palleronia caenipelagi TaxID=2489174 RepID=A0A547Q8C7_9RHOB|nr:ABC transporter permease [Palleronia caenipelagi]TRD22638.1 ABC transporter permease [Palleronia caenipelagi]